MLFHIDYNNSQPIYQQVIEQIETLRASTVA